MTPATPTAWSRSPMTNMFSWSSAFDPVKGGDFLAGTGASGNQGVSGQGVQVVGMKWLAVLQHDEVRNIHDIADRANARAAQPLRGAKPAMAPL